MGVEGGGSCMYVPSLTFRILRSRQCPLSCIESIFTSFVAIIFIWSYVAVSGACRFSEFYAS